MALENNLVEYNPLCDKCTAEERESCLAWQLFLQACGTEMPPEQFKKRIDEARELARQRGCTKEGSF